MKQFQILLLFFYTTIHTISAQGVAVNNSGTPADAKALLDVSSVSKGVLLPRMTSLQRLAIAPALQQKGLLVFDTDSSAFVFWNGITWQTIKNTSQSMSATGWTQAGNNLFNNNTGNTGIGTSDPRAPLQVAARKTVLFGADTSGAGPKMIWKPSKSAFRVGTVGPVHLSPDADSMVWNHDSIGQYSFSSGMNNTAISEGAIAMGAFQKVRGNYGIALGYRNTNDGDYSFTSGYLNKLIGSFSAVIGREDTVTGSNSFVFGQYSKLQGDASILLGSFGESKGSGNFIGGHAAKVFANRGTAIGFGTMSNSFGSMSLGTFNDTIAGASRSQWINSDPLLIVGRGSDYYERSNAMIMLKNGWTGFGTNAPTTLMHLKFASSPGNGHLKLEESNPDFSRITFRNSNPGFWELGAFAQGLWQYSGLAEFNFYYSGVGVNVLSIKGNGNATFGGTVTQSSDERLKKNITPLKNVLSKLLQVNGYSYKWKDEKRGEEEHLGLLAQELERQFPQLVSTDKQGLKSVAYSNMVALLLEAIKELQHQIDGLKLRLDAK